MIELSRYLSVPLAIFLEGKRVPGDGCIEERSPNQSGRMALAEQPQRFFGVALNDDDIWRLLAVSCQNACAHPAGNFVNLRKIQNVVEDAHNMDDVTTPIGDNSLHQLARHAPTACASKTNRASYRGETRARCACAY